MSSLSIMIPQNIDLAHRIKNNPPKFDFNMDFVYYFINMLILATSQKLSLVKEDKKVKWESFCKNYDLKQFFISNNTSNDIQKLEREYRKHFDYLLTDFQGSKKILWQDKKTKPYGYQLSPEYFKQTLKLYQITDEKLLKSIALNGNTKIDNRITKKYSFVIQYFDTERLKIDFNNAKNHIERMYQSDDNLMQYKINMAKIQNLNNGNYRLSLKLKTDGRIHSNITSFPKDLRHFLTYDDSVMGEVDIHASGFFFLYYLLVTDKNSAFLKNLEKNNPLLYGLYIGIKKESKLNQLEVQKFGDMVLKGELYDFFIDEYSRCFDDEYFSKNLKELFNEEFTGEYEQVKKVVKKKLLALLYASPFQFKKEQAIFYNAFPSIHLFIKKFKKLKYNGYEKREWHKKMAHLGLQTESYFMLHIIARTLNKTKLGSEHKRKIPFFTLHDCLVVKKEDMKLVKQFMAETFVKEMGFAPVLNDKVWELN